MKDFIVHEEWFRHLNLPHPYTIWASELLIKLKEENNNTDQIKFIELLFLSLVKKAKGNKIFIRELFKLYSNIKSEMKNLSVEL